MEHNYSKHSWHTAGALRLLWKFLTGHDSSVTSQSWSHFFFWVPNWNSWIQDNYNNDTNQCLRHVSSSNCLCYTYAVRGEFSEALNTGRSEWKADCAPVRLDFTSEKRQTSEEAVYNAHLFDHSAPVGFTAKEDFSERSQGSCVWRALPKAQSNVHLHKLNARKRGWPSSWSWTFSHSMVKSQWWVWRALNMGIFLLPRRGSCFGMTHGLQKAFKCIFHGKDLKLSEFKQHWQLSTWLGQEHIKPEVQLISPTGKPNSTTPVCTGCDWDGVNILHSGS